MVLLDLPESRDYFESMLIAAGVTPQIRYRSASYETVRGLVARGHGHSILNQRPASEGTYDGGSVAVVPIKGDAPGLPIVLARSAAVRTTARARAVAVAARAIFPPIPLPRKHIRRNYRRGVRFCASARAGRVRFAGSPDPVGGPCIVLVPFDRLAPWRVEKQHVLAKVSS
jgi:hypothetical protein